MTRDQETTILNLYKRQMTRQPPTETKSLGSSSSGWLRKTLTQGSRWAMCERRGKCSMVRMAMLDATVRDLLFARVGQPDHKEMWPFGTVTSAIPKGAPSTNSNERNRMRNLTKAANRWSLTLHRCARTPQNHQGTFRTASLGLCSDFRWACDAIDNRRLFLG